MSSLLAITEGRFEDARARMRCMKVVRDPEVLVYLARHFSYMGDGDEAIRLIRHAADSGFVCAPFTLRSDSWLFSVRAHAEYQSVLADMTHRVRKTQRQGSPFPS
jgi:hypothetical protein